MTNLELFKTTGNTPAVTNSGNNNGIKGFVNLKPTEAGGIITYSDTTTSETIFYQPYDFVGYSHVQGLYPYDKNKWSEKSLLFFVTLFRKSANNRFDYANKFNRNVAKELSVSLPVTENKEIAFDFMENYISGLEKEYIRELEKERICGLEKYLKASGLDNYILTEEEQNAVEKVNNNQVIFEKFSINNLFDIATGKDFIIGNAKKGNIPLISHTNENNSIVAYVEEVKNRRIFSFKKTIALADRGIFYATAQDKNFHIGTRVKALTFKDGDKSEEVRLFVTSSINKLQILFADYLTNATDKLPNLEIELPIINNKIAYAFMETYIRAVEKLVIKNVMDWKDKIINKTKEVISE